ncbi:hypothetical protein JCGZ_19695 [Jatropha curcas]|uniref:Uncharacterized protein n=1 Tax=Jatropha curcas TaxID=180498 RepID=A0A067LK30_JATCU|nr:hypothetical protein JCGZ_19695 [Jatropha curcas]
MPPPYKRSRPVSSVTVRNRPIALPSTASPPPVPPPTAPVPPLFEIGSPEQQERPVYDTVGGGKGTRLDLDVMLHMKLVEKIGDSYRIMGTQEEGFDEEEAEDASDTNMEEGNPNPFSGFGTSFGASTSGASPSFQGASNLYNDEVLARIMSRIDIFDTRLNGMESMIADRFQSIEIMLGSLDSRIDTMQGQYKGIASQLQTVI